MEPRRAYRVLGLPYGAPRDAVKNAYRDMAQVWHPDRFESNERLHDKAEKALKRINEAYQTLKDYEPPPGPTPQSLLDSTMSAIRDLGDMMDSAVRPPPGAAPRTPPRAAGKEDLPNVVLGLGNVEATHVHNARRHRKKRRRRRLLMWLLILVLLVVATGAAVYLMGAFDQFRR